jgi:hypothetical protein
MQTLRRGATSMIPPALSADALYGKAMVYARRALEAKNGGEEDAYQLWGRCPSNCLESFF